MSWKVSVRTWASKVSFLALLVSFFVFLKACGEISRYSPAGEGATTSEVSGGESSSGDNSLNIPGGATGVDGGVGGLPDSGFAEVFLEFVNDATDTIGSTDFSSFGGVSYHPNSRGTGTVAKLNGTTGYFMYDTTVTNPFNMNNRVFSISFWFSTSASGVQYLMEEDTSYGRDYISMRLINGTVRAAYSTDWPGGSNEVIIDSTTTDLNDGEWHHVVFVRNGARTGQLYIDNVLEAQDSNNAGSASGINPIDSHFYIGRDVEGTSYLNGTIDDFYWVDGATFDSTDVNTLFSR